jgi:hypothetical protein
MMEDASVFIAELLLRSLRFLSFIRSQDSIANSALVIARLQLATGIMIRPVTVTVGRKARNVRPNPSPSQVGLRVSRVRRFRRVRLAATCSQCGARRRSKAVDQVENVPELGLDSDLVAAMAISFAVCSMMLLGTAHAFIHGSNSLLSTRLTKNYALESRPRFLNGFAGLALRVKAVPIISWRRAKETGNILSTSMQSERSPGDYCRYFFIVVSLFTVLTDILSSSSLPSFCTWSRLSIWSDLSTGE